MILTEQNLFALLKISLGFRAGLRLLLYDGCLVLDQDPHSLEAASTFTATVMIGTFAF